jgi:hypothetical protein
MFDPGKIKLKYILGIHKDLPGYPAGEDILYFVIKRHYEKDGSDDITFTDNFIIKKLGQEHLDTIVESLNKLVNDGYLAITRETKDSTTYKVLINDYIKNAI